MIVRGRVSRVCEANRNEGVFPGVIVTTDEGETTVPMAEETARIIVREFKGRVVMVGRGPFVLDHRGKKALFVDGIG